jgi:hypothetical protein
MKLFGYEIVEGKKLDELRRLLEEEKRIASQVHFLLSQCSIREAPKTLFEAAQNRFTRFAYIHPETFGEFTRMPRSNLPDGTFEVASVHPTTTTWVLTPLVPRVGVVYTDQVMPGVQL